MSRELIERMREALEVLYCEADGFSVSGVYFNEECMCHKGLDLACKAIEEADLYLEAPEQSGPVGTIGDMNNARMFTLEANGYSRKDKLYTHPSPQTAELTDAEIAQIFQDETGFYIEGDDISHYAIMDFARAVLAAQRVTK
jgi:hypothetical protein